MSTSPYFSGPDRVEIFPPLNKPMRMGAPAALRVSDQQRLANLIAAGDEPAATALFGLVQFNHLMLNAGYVEWVLQLQNQPQLAGLWGDLQDLWHERCRSLPTTPEEQELLIKVADRFQQTAAMPEALARYRETLAANTPNLALEILAPALHAGQDLLSALAADPVTAQDLLDRYFRLSVLLHDALAQYVAVAGESACRMHDQATAEKLIQESFSSLSFFAGMCALATSLPAAELAAFLAEHLRSHFSGTDRGGSVEIIENDAEIRLVFAPCGSGGALRQRLPAEAQGRLPEASAMTWNRAGEVPAYCAHCAFNELTTIARQGFAAFTTAFDPDPEQPCGWTIPKTRSAGGV